MRNWQVMLEHFALYPEPQPWEVPRHGSNVRLSSAQKWEAVQYLAEKGFLQIAGRVKGEGTTLLYQITPVGQFVWQAGFCELKRRGGPKPQRKVEQAPSLAQRAVAKGFPRTVWELAEKPWKWVKKLEHDRFTDAELARSMRG